MNEDARVGDRIARSQVEVKRTDRQRQELDRRLDADPKDPSAGRLWSAVRNGLGHDRS
jgi:putative addiction module component (TIGR02574 family)